MNLFGEAPWPCLPKNRRSHRTHRRKMPRTAKGLAPRQLRGPALFSVQSFVCFGTNFLISFSVFSSTGGPYFFTISSTFVVGPFFVASV